MKISQKLQLIKRLTRLTQEKLAKELGVSFVTLNSWINDKSIPRLKKQKIINELYFKYTGQKDIPDSKLDAKKQILVNKSKKYKNILKTINNNSDIFEQFVLELTYHSNKIEGSTLTEDETADILFNNRSIPNKDIIEHLEVKNHQSVLSFLFNNVKQGFKIDEEYILRLHQILMNSIREDAGNYRTHGVRIVGSNVPTSNYLKVPRKMKQLVKDINKKENDIISHVANIHSQFEQVHPFSDGNGRIGRLLIQIMLLRDNYVPAVIKQDNKRLYLTYLRKSQLEGRFSMWEDFLCDSILLGFDILERK
ncbi:MAG: Fic family protein [Parcubacteria group bacterium]|nr:Fic family protein [Parcubacteria group bacterium]